MGCWNDHPTWYPLLMAPMKVWTSWPNAKIQICNSFTPAKSNLDWQQVTTTQKWQQRIVTEKLFHVYIFLLYHTMLIFYTGLVSVYMHRSLFMWCCQGSGNQLKSDPMPLLSHFLLFKVHDKVGRNSQQCNSVANGITCCEWKFSSHELTRSFRRPCARITLRSALKPPLIDQCGTTTGRRATLSLRTFKWGQAS